MINLAKSITRRLALNSSFAFSYKNSLVNATPANFVDKREALKENRWLEPDHTHKVLVKILRNRMRLILVMENILSTKYQ
jgi:hypothetical protein